MEKEKGFLGEYGFDILRILLSAVIFTLGYFLPVGTTVKIVLYAFSLAVCGIKLILGTIEEIKEKNFVNENTLMIIASVTAFILGEYFESVIIVVLFSFGEILEDAATDKSKAKIESLNSLKTDKVNLIISGEIVETDAEKVKIGSRVLVKKGEILPIDGALLSDNAMIDYKSVTGESGIKAVSKDEKIYSGGINTGDPIEIITEKEYGESTVGRIIKTVEDCTEKKAKSQRFITVFARYYTPIVVVLAVLLCVIPPLFDGNDFVKWIYKALSFLVISCPCALVISVPLSFFIGIGGLAKRGILVKGGNYIEDAAKIKSVVFDKTGTITVGDFSVVKCEIYKETEVFAKSIAFSLENASSHPIATAIREYCKKGDIVPAFLTEITEIAGKGVSGISDGKKYFLGSIGFAKECGLKINAKSEGTACVLFESGKIIAVFYLEDKIKDSAYSCINDLKNMKITPIVLSGDGKNAVKTVCEKLGIEEYGYSLLPEEKAERIENIKENLAGKIAFSGDGINDAPSIALSDVGIAMGGLGSGVAIESADAVVLDDDLKKVPLFIRASKKIRKIAIENIAFSIALKLAVMVLSVCIKLPLIFAMLADVGLMLIAVLNAFRCAKLK